MESEAKNSCIVHVVKGLVAAYIITVVILGVLTAILWKMHATEGFLSGGITITYIASCFLGGFLVGKSTKEKRFLWHILLSYLLCLLLQGREEKYR